MLKKFICLSILVFIIFSLPGCRILGGFDNDNADVSAPVTYSVAGKVSIPSSLLSNSIRVSSEVPGSMVKANLALDSLNAYLYDKSDKMIAGPVPVDKASGTFVLTQIPPGENYRVKIFMSGHCLLQSHIDQLNVNESNIPVNVDTTAVSLLVEKSSYSINSKQVEASVISGEVNLEAVATAINNWLANDLSANDKDVMTMILSNIGESTLIDMVKSVPASSTAILTPLPPGQTNQIAAPSGVIGISADGSIQLQWQAVQGAVGYNIYWSDKAGFITTTATRIRGVTSPFRFTPPVLGNKYYFVITAVSAMGESPASSEVEITGQQATSIPAAPTGVFASAASGSVSISWIQTPGVSEYNIYYGKQPDISKVNGTKIENIIPPYIHQGLINGETYYYIITAANSLGESAESAVVNATPATAPGKPTGLKATSGEYEVILEWEPVAGAKSYTLYFGLNSVNTFSGFKLAGVTSPFKHNSLQGGQTYSYILVAENESGISPESDVVSAISRYRANEAAPAPILLNNPDKETNSTSATFLAAGAGYVSFAYQLDGGTWSDLLSIGVALNLSNLSVGQHSLIVKGMQQDNNFGQNTLTYSWEVLDSSTPVAYKKRLVGDYRLFSFSAGTGNEMRWCSMEEVSVSGDQATGIEKVPSTGEQFTNTIIETDGELSINGSTTKRGLVSPSGNYAIIHNWQSQDPYVGLFIKKATSANTTTLNGTYRVYECSDDIDAAFTPLRATTQAYTMTFSNGNFTRQSLFDPYSEYDSSLSNGNYSISSDGTVTIAGSETNSFTQVSADGNVFVRIAYVQGNYCDMTIGIREGSGSFNGNYLRVAINAGVYNGSYSSYSASSFVSSDGSSFTGLDVKTESTNLFGMYTENYTVNSGIISIPVAPESNYGSIDASGELFCITTKYVNNPIDGRFFTFGVKK